jgi:hypothetical protein
MEFVKVGVPYNLPKVFFTFEKFLQDKYGTLKFTISLNQITKRNHYLQPSRFDRYFF